MSRSVEETNRWMLRARDAMDRDFAGVLDVRSLAVIACVSEAHFIRSFKATFGETPHRYLQRRRIERAMFLLRTSGRSVTQVCMEVGFTSLGSFSRIFTDIVGTTPTAFRDAGPMGLEQPVPSCFVKAWTRPSTFTPSSFGEAS